MDQILKFFFHRKQLTINNLVPPITTRKPQTTVRTTTVNYTTTDFNSMMMQNDFIPCKTLISYRNGFLLRNNFDFLLRNYEIILNSVEPRKYVTGSYYLDEIKPLLNQELQLHNLHSPATFSNFTTVSICPLIDCIWNWNSSFLQ